MFILHNKRFDMPSMTTEELGPQHGEVRRAHQMLNAALDVVPFGARPVTFLTNP